MTYEDSLFALADPTRRALFEAVAAAPASVAELARDRPVSRPAVSQHLKVLERAALVKATPVGNRRIYALDHSGLLALRSYLDRFWNDALQAYQAEILRQNAEPQQN